MRLLPKRLQICSFNFKKHLGFQIFSLSVNFTSMKKKLKGKKEEQNFLKICKMMFEEQIKTEIKI